MKRVAIVIASQHGQTAKIAKTIQGELDLNGILSDVIQPDKPFGSYEGAIIASPIYIGKFNPEIVEWTKANAAKLNLVRTAFFSVSLNAADKRAAAKSANEKLLKEFLETTGLRADFLSSVAGALHYTKYGWLKRWLLKRISAANGGPTDTSRDHELTDWAQVRAFANAFVQGDTTSPFAHCDRPDSTGVLGQVARLDTLSNS
jgi:menaquinone-dependent protoporphyrinogen oxidase